MPEEFFSRYPSQFDPGASLVIKRDDSSIMVEPDLASAQHIAVRRTAHISRHGIDYGCLIFRGEDRIEWMRAGVENVVSGFDGSRTWFGGLHEIVPKVSMNCLTALYMIAAASRCVSRPVAM